MRSGHPTREKLDMDWSIARGSDSPFPYTLDPIWKNLKMNTLNRNKAHKPFGFAV